jgi:hypothetical protein
MSLLLPNFTSFVLCFFKDYFISKDFFQKEYSKEIPVVSKISYLGGYESAESDRVHEEVRKKSVEDLIEVVTIDDEEQLNVKSSPDTKPNSTKKSFWKMLTGSSKKKASK